MTRTNIEQLHLWLGEPEGTRFEFKKALDGYAFDKLLRYCVALSNEGGGKIILGVTDKRPRAIAGTKAFPEPGETEASIFQRLSFRVTIEEINSPQGRVLIVHVPGRLPGMPRNLDGAYLRRSGDAVIAMSADEIRDIFSETGPDFSVQCHADATLADLSENAVIDFRNRWSKKENDSRKSHWNVVDTLRDAELLKDGKITYAALILFGTREALGRLLPQAEIIFEYRSSEAAGPASERQEFREGLFLCYDALWKKVNLRNNRQSYQDGLFRMEIPTFDEISVRESLLNAVAHRDYRLGGSIFIKQYDKRLEVISPGGFPAGITPENILDQQNPRNRRLAEALNRCGLIERSGQGVDLMFETAIRQGKALPDFRGTSAHQVYLTLEGTVKSLAFVRFLERLGQERLQSFSSHDFLTLDYIYREVTLPDYLKPRIANLLEIGAIQSVGRGRGTRYILSQSLYSALGARGVHTRKHGLDHETHKALIEKHLRMCGNEGAQRSELHQVIPQLSEGALKKLLKEMKLEARILLKGKKRGSRWYLAK